VPGIFRLACDSCEYSVEGITSRTSVILADGSSEKVCGHPLERRVAERTTGRSWSELVRANRIVYRYALVCLACGALDYYSAADLARGSVHRGHLANIVHLPSPRRARDCICRTCGARRLYPLVQPRGVVASLAQAAGLRRQSVACPRCHAGKLHSRLVAKS
jgi:hypothetical protein